MTEPSKQINPWWYLIHLFVLLLIIFAIPLIMKISFGIWTFSVQEALDYDVEQKSKELDCDWGKVKQGTYWECQTAPCKRYNIDDLDCMREGYSGILDFREYYVCKDYGRVVKSCVEYYTLDDAYKEYPKEENYIIIEDEFKEAIEEDEVSDNV